MVQGLKKREGGRGNSEGFSLVETCMVLLIFALLSSMAILSFNQILMRQEREQSLQNLETAIEYAKQEAISRKTVVSICGSYNQKTCHSNNWSSGFIIFENEFSESDPKPNRILHIFPGVQYGKLYFEQWGRNLNFYPNGRTDNVGTFTYCPKNKDRREADGLVINKAGHTYRPVLDKNLNLKIKQAGTPEARPLTCR